MGGQRYGKSKGLTPWLTEQVCYGGEWMSRGAMIADLQRVAKANGLSPRCVDAYLCGGLARERARNGQ